MEDALAGIGRDLPDIALVDIGLPGISGIEGIPLLLARHPALSTWCSLSTMTTSGSFKPFVRRLWLSLEKDTTRAFVGKHLRSRQCGAAMSPEVARRVMAVFKSIRPPEHADYQLTPHETRSSQAARRGP